MEKVKFTIGDKTFKIPVEVYNHISELEDRNFQKKMEMIDLETKLEVYEAMPEEVKGLKKAYLDACRYCSHVISNPFSLNPMYCAANVKCENFCYKINKEA